jgi:hypothetical protein
LPDNGADFGFAKIEFVSSEGFFSYVKRPFVNVCTRFFGNPGQLPSGYVVEVVGGFNPLACSREHLLSLLRLFVLVNSGALLAQLSAV